MRVVSFTEDEWAMTVAVLIHVKNNEKVAPERVQSILEKIRDEAVEVTTEPSRSGCDHPWHGNPGLIGPCPECDEGSDIDPDGGYR